MKAINIYITLVFIVVTITASAQPGPPSNPVPLGAIELLLLSGIGLGAYKKYKK